MELNSNFTVPGLLIFSGVSLFIMGLSDLKMKKWGLGSFTTAGGLYLVIFGLLPIFVKNIDQSTLLTALLIAFIPSMLIVYIGYDAIVGQIKVNDAFQKETDKGVPHGRT